MSASKAIEFTQIAADWDSIRLGEENPQALLVIRNGLTAKQDQATGDYRVSRIETIRDGKIDETRVRYASGITEEDAEKYRIRNGDILFSHINSDPHLGKTALADRDYENLLHGMNLLLIRANPEVFEPEFLNRIFQYYRNIGVFISICSRSVNQSSINQAKLKAVEVPLPPLLQQKQIAHILATVQRAIEAQERIIQTTTELKQALMQKLFSEGLRGEPQKETEIGLVPESWEVVPLSEVCQFLSGGTPSKQNPEFWQGSIPWVSPKDMKRPRLQDAQDHISQEALESGSKLAPAGSVLVVVRGMILAKTVPVALAEVPVAINQDMKAIVPGPKLTSDYLLYALEAFRENLFKRVGRSGHGTCTLMGHEIADLQIPLPPIRAQHEIAETILSTDKKILSSTRKQSTLSALFASSLNTLITKGNLLHLPPLHSQ